MRLQSGDFGDTFIWGVSSSAYQTEGAYLEDGKGLSIWDVFTERKGKVHLGQHGKWATGFYQRYVQDIILMEFLGIQNFRLSLSWSRIFPGGVGTPNENGIEFYNRLIDFCLECGIQPWATLYHLDLPQALEEKGGWTNREIIHWFEEYVAFCIKTFGDRVQHWMVLNEPMAFTGAGYFLGIHAPGQKKGFPASCLLFIMQPCARPMAYEFVRTSTQIYRWALHFHVPRLTRLTIQNHL